MGAARAVPGGEVRGLFFLSPSTGFIETDDGAAIGRGPGADLRHLRWGQALAGGLGRRPALGAQGGSPTAIGDCCDKNGVSFASPRVGFATGHCVVGAALQRTSDGGRKWGLHRHCAR